MKNMTLFIFLVSLAPHVFSQASASLDKDDSVHTEKGMNAITPPSFPTRYGNIQDYLVDHIHYPADAYAYGITGAVKLKVELDKRGSVSKVIVVSGLDRFSNLEATRVLQSMPAWNPAQAGGKSVPSAFYVTVHFK